MVVKEKSKRHVMDMRHKEERISTKVLITNPPWIYQKDGETFLGVRTGSRWPFSYKAPSLSGRFLNWLRGFSSLYMPYPVFMGYAVSYLRSKGIDAVFYDAAAQGHNYNNFFKHVDAIKPDIVIQETACASFDIDLGIAERLHKKYEICLVGPQATALAEKVIALPYVDYVLKGAYEYSALEMIRTRQKKIYEYQIADINDLPYPYRDGSIIHNYRDFNCVKKLGFPQLWIYATRGCAFSCDFCLWVHAMFNNKLSLGDPEKVVGEADDMARIYGFKHVYFDDDCWNVGPEERLRRIADGMKKIGLPWTINARLDLSTKDAFKYFVDRGCAGLRLGVESLSQRLLDLIHKDLTVGDIMEKIRFLENTGVELYLLFMHRMPGESESDRLEQAKRIGELGHRFQNPPCVPFPGTPYYKKIKDAGLLDLEHIGWREFDAVDIGKNLLKIIDQYSQKTAK